MPFEQLEAEDRQRIVIEHAPTSLIAFFLVIAYVGVIEWVTRPTHRTAVLVVGGLYVAITAVCVALLRRRPRWAVPIAVGGVSALCAAMLSYSPMVHGSGELCVLAVNILLGGFTVMFPLGLRSQVLASIVPVVGYATVLQLGTTTAFPVWYSASALLVFLVVLAIGARILDLYRARILQDAFQQASLAAENGRLRDEARAADRAKSDLVSILSHELRTPIGTIRNFAELLIEGAVTDADDLQEVMHHIREQSNRTVDLVHTMLEFSSIESGRLKVAVEEFGVAEMLGHLRAEVPTVWHRPNVEVRWQLPPKGVRMRTDQGKVEAIVRNLLHNALRHTMTGSVSVSAVAESDGLAVHFAVTDTGEGIAPDALPQIFERFSRATLTKGGFGLGLFIVKRFAEVLGGTISVDSTPGVGTRFEAIVPVQAPTTTGNVLASRAA